MASIHEMIYAFVFISSYLLPTPSLGQGPCLSFHGCVPFPIGLAKKFIQVFLYPLMGNPNKFLANPIHQCLHTGGVMNCCCMEEGVQHHAWPLVGPQKACILSPRHFAGAEGSYLSSA